MQGKKVPTKRSAAAAAMLAGPEEDFETILNATIIKMQSKDIFLVDQKAVNKCNKNFGKWEQIKKFELTPNEWSIDGGHLTPTMKMKRKIIKKIYIDLYEKIYRGQHT